MRRIAFFIGSLVSMSAIAADYPEPSDPVAKSMLAQYIQDRPMIDSPAMFALPAKAPAWPCDVPEIEQYKLAGLNQAHPALREEFEKMTRKAFRDAGMSAQMMPKTTFSNIQIIPLKAQCTNGKLDGELQLLSTYDKRDESHTSTPFGSGVVNGTTVLSMHAISRAHRILSGGEMGPASITFMEMTTQNETHYDNAQMEASMQKSNEQLGLNKPMTIRTATYVGQGGVMATFMSIDEKKVSGGLFGVSVTTVPSLTSTFTLPIDARRKRSESYKNKQLITTSGTKDDKPHGEQITYMDNYLKKLNMRLDQQPGMENSREVTINGVELIEMRTCMQNGAAVKISPCPAE